MIKRIVDISNPSYLHLRNSQLVIERDRKEVGTVPIEDLGVLILDHPAITHTQGLLAACCKNNVAIVFSDEKHLPGAVLLPLMGGALHSKTIGQQIQVTDPVRKRLWQEIVQAKIRAQASVLLEVHGIDEPLFTFVGKVKSGDPDNIEGRAARIYWRKLFGKDFRRDPDLPGINSLLNYGYAVLRAAVARSIVATGLHPALGVHHHNQYDSLCLADDLMEPLRPAVDRKVYAVQDKPQISQISQITTEMKRELLSLLSDPFTVQKKSLPLITALHHYAASVRKVICKETKKVVIPVF